jgi:4-azaleucine resistance transporter AzlC
MNRDALRDGMGAAWPICMGFIPIGLSLGVLAQKTGLSPLQMLFMSVLVFAGGSQFIAVGMVGAGGSLAAIVLTTFVVNLRHLLMSSALAVHFPRVSRRFLVCFAYGITDESFALNSARFREGGWDRWRALTVNQVTNATWVVSTVAGVYAGSLIPAGAFGIDFALPAMFIALLVFQFRGRLHVLTAIIAGGLSVLLSLRLEGNGHIILASLAAATIGLALKAVRRRRLP